MRPDADEDDGRKVLTGHAVLDSALIAGSAGRYCSYMSKTGNATYGFAPEDKTQCYANHHDTSDAQKGWLPPIAVPPGKVLKVRWVSDGDNQNGLVGV